MSDDSTIILLADTTPGRKKKKGSKAAGVTNKAKLQKAIKDFKAKGGDPRGKEGARLKSSQQRLGTKVGLSDKATNLPQPNVSTGSTTTNTKNPIKKNKKKKKNAKLKSVINDFKASGSTVKMSEASSPKA